MKYLSEAYLEKLLDAHLTDSRGAEHYAYDLVKREIAASPGADVEEVKHGYWDPVVYKAFGQTWPEYECSVCGHHDDRHRFIRAPYCWACGAKMDQVK